MNKLLLILSTAICFFIPDTLLMSDKPIFNCPELFDAVGINLQISSNTWNKVCYTNYERLENDIESGEESGSGDESGSGNIQRYWICDFICNKYREGCIRLTTNIYSTDLYSKQIGYNKQDFLKSCFGWEELSMTTTGITTTIKTNITSTIPSITTYFTKSTIPNTNIVTSINDSVLVKKKDKYNKLAGDIGILTTLGLMVLSALGICLYYTYKNPHP